VNDDHVRLLELHNEKAQSNINRMRSCQPPPIQQEQSGKTRLGEIDELVSGLAVLLNVSGQSDTSLLLVVVPPKYFSLVSVGSVMM
jgi:hypothetical protein